MSGGLTEEQAKAVRVEARRALSKGEQRERRKAIKQARQAQAILAQRAAQEQPAFRPRYRIDRSMMLTLSVHEACRNWSKYAAEGQS